MGGLKPSDDEKLIFSGISSTVYDIERLGQYVVLGKVDHFNQETYEKLAVAAQVAQICLFIQEPIQAVQRTLKNSIVGKKSGSDALVFTEKRALGIISTVELEVVHPANQEKPDSNKPRELYPLERNRFAYAYHSQEKKSGTYIDIYEKIPFIEKMYCTESMVLPESHFLSYITPQGIAVILQKMEELQHIFFRRLGESSTHLLLAPFSKLISNLYPKGKLISLRAVSFAHRNNLVAVLLKVGTLCTLLIGHQTKTDLPILQINPPKECHTCAWDADEMGIITNAHYYKYPFALGLLNTLKKPPAFPEAQQIILHKAHQEISDKNPSLEKAEIIMSTL